MAGEGLAYLVILAMIFFVVFVLLPIGLGIFFLFRYKKRKSMEARGIEPKKKYRAKILFGAAITLIGFGVFVFSANIIATQIQIQQITEITERNRSAGQIQSRLDSISFNIYANSSECCFIGLRLYPDTKHDGYGHVEFVRHIPGCSATTYSNCPEKDEILHTYDFRTTKNDTRYFNTDLNEYQFPISEADRRVLNQTDTYDLIITYTPVESDTVYSQRLWNQTLDFKNAQVEKG